MWPRARPAAGSHRTGDRRSKPVMRHAPAGDAPTTCGSSLAGALAAASSQAADDMPDQASRASLQTGQLFEVAVDVLGECELQTVENGRHRPLVSAGGPGQLPAGSRPYRGGGHITQPIKTSDESPAERKQRPAVAAGCSHRLGRRLAAIRRATAGQGQHVRL